MKGRGKKRDWKSYEKKLVKRGEMLIPLGMAEEWKRELEDMNAGKEGAPYEYPGQLIECLSLWKCLCKIPYRTSRGLRRADFGCCWG